LTYFWHVFKTFFQDDVFSRASSVDGWQYTPLSGLIFYGHRRSEETRRRRGGEEEERETSQQDRLR